LVASAALLLLVGSGLFQATGSASDPFLVGHVFLWLFYLMLTSVLVLAGLATARTAWFGALLSTLVVLAIKLLGVPGAW
jgi:Na+-driven multidrug efflux pump